MNQKPSNAFGLHPIIIPLAMLILVAGAASTWIFGRTHAQYQALVPYPEPKVIADFALVDGQGMAFGLDRFRSNWDLVFFGFTYCPDICPGTLAELKAVHDLLVDSGHADVVDVNFISVDPERDSPERLNSYVTYFHPKFQAATGPVPQLQALTRQTGIFYHVEEHEAGQSTYQVDHGAAILVFDPEGRLAGVWPAPHDAAVIASDLDLLIDRRGG